MVQDLERHIAQHKLRRRRRFLLNFHGICFQRWYVNGFTAFELVGSTAIEPLRRHWSFRYFISAHSNSETQPSMPCKCNANASLTTFGMYQPLSPDRCALACYTRSPARISINILPWRSGGRPAMSNVDIESHHELNPP